MKDLFDSVVRTFVPWIVGAVIGWFVSRGIELDPSVETGLTMALTGGASALYYVVARFLETRVSPRFGWLLGMDKTPTYTGKHAAN